MQTCDGRISAPPANWPPAVAEETFGQKGKIMSKKSDLVKCLVAAIIIVGMAVEAGIAIPRLVRALPDQATNLIIACVCVWVHPSDRQRKRAADIGARLQTGPANAGPGAWTAVRLPI